MNGLSPGCIERPNLRWKATLFLGLVATNESDHAPSHRLQEEWNGHDRTGLDDPLEG